MIDTMLIYRYIIIINNTQYLIDILIIIISINVLRDRKKFNETSVQNVTLAEYFNGRTNDKFVVSTSWKLIQLSDRINGGRVITRPRS